MFYYFYLAKHYKIANNSTTTKATEKISTALESTEFWEKIDLGVAKFKNNQILLDKIIYRFLLTTKLFNG
jgi:hypothetical protein